jgi:GNAT superfamily N-acetyltransferase
MSHINYDEIIDVDVISDKEDLSGCNFKEKDGSDPLEVDDFVRNRMTTYSKNNLCVIYVVRNEGKTIGFYTLSMGALEVKKLKEQDRIESVPQLIAYPAVLVGNMGLDIDFRKKGLGRWIVNYFIGQILDYSKEIGCGYVFLQTNEDKRGFYEKLHFVTSGKLDNKGRMWMHRRIFAKIYLAQFLNLCVLVIMSLV